MNFLKKLFTKQGKNKEEDKKSESSFTEKRRQEISSNTKPESSFTEKRRQEISWNTIKFIDIINSARLGTNNYDFESQKLIKEGGQGHICSIKSKIDGKTYALKRLKY